jgi:5-methylcytosine-specific restriction endonuclease McrA
MNAFIHEKRKVLTVLERAQLFALDNGHCRKCTRKIPPNDDWDADHVISLANGGTNAFPDNWQTLCSWCHDDKTFGDGGDLSRAAKSKRTFAQHVVPKRFTRSRSWGRSR